MGFAWLNPSYSLSWWVLEKTGSAAAMGAVAVFSLVPMLLFLLVGGVVVDRLPRFRIMLASDAVNACIVGLIAVLAQLHRLEVWHIYTASIVFGLAEAFFYPAYNASVPQVVPAEALPSANSLTSLSWQISGVAGPSLGAMIGALSGIERRVKDFLQRRSEILGNPAVDAKWVVS